MLFRSRLPRRAPGNIYVTPALRAPTPPPRPAPCGTTFPATVQHRQAWPPTSSPRYIPKDQHPQILNLPPPLPSSLSPGSLGPSIHWRVPTPPAWQAPTPVRGSPRPVTVTLTLLQFTSLLPEHPVPLLSPRLSSQGLSSSCPMAPSAHTPAALLASEVGGGGQGGCRRHGLASGVWGLFMHWRRKWQPTPVFLPGESQERGSLVGCRLWGRTESDMTEVT